jgi:hypothetical protein
VLRYAHQLNKKVNKMNSSIKTELLNHVNDLVNDGVIDESCFEEWHYYAFNEDYYIIGYWNASEWLKKHDLDPFEAIGELIELQDLHFGSSPLQAKDINSEGIVNDLVFFYGYELGLDNSAGFEEFKQSLADELEG